MSISAERFAQGMTVEQYMAQMTENKDEFAANYENAAINRDDVAFFTNLGLPLNVAVLAEDWCGDSLFYFPVLARLATEVSDEVSDWQVRVFLRDSNLDLADEYPDYDGTSHIPTFVFLDEDMRDLAVFIERPAQANFDRQEIIDQLAASNPAIEAGKTTREQSEEARALLSDPLSKLAADRKGAWQQAMVDEVREALQRVMVARTLAEH